MKLNDLESEVSANLRESIATRKSEYAPRRFTETSTLCEVEFQLEIDRSPEIRNSTGYSPAEVELVGVKVWGVDIPLTSIPEDIKDALMEGIA
jgi:hypothetical protein